MFHVKHYGFIGRFGVAFRLISRIMSDCSLDFMRVLSFFARSIRFSMILAFFYDYCNNFCFFIAYHMTLYGDFSAICCLEALFVTFSDNSECFLCIL